MQIVLVPGLWLNGESWQPVADRLVEAGHTVQSLTLPGMESKESSRHGINLSDHVAAVVAAVDAAGDEVLLVGHSASSALAFCAANARPDNVRRVVYVGGFPAPDGEQFMAGFEPVGDDVPFPGWAAFEGPDSADIDEPTKRRLLEEFIPSPAGVLAGTVRLSDERRYAVPATAVCPEYTPDDLRAWIAAGDVPELARTAHLEIVDIDSGHWPQLTQPEKFADLLLTEAQR
ncbi:MAG: alpha/beta fold hydrolase [Jatrophihabitans sp.]